MNTFTLPLSCGSQPSLAQRETEAIVPRTSNMPQQPFLNHTHILNGACDASFFRYSERLLHATPVPHLAAAVLVQNIGIQNCHMRVAMTARLAPQNRSLLAQNKVPLLYIALHFVPAISPVMIRDFVSIAVRLWRRKESNFSCPRWSIVGHIQ